MGERLLMLWLWWLLAFLALGLYCLGRAVRGERGWLPVVLKLAAVFILLPADESYLWQPACSKAAIWAGWRPLIGCWSGRAGGSHLSLRQLAAAPGRALPE
jgi:hypothetical protein